MGSICFYFQVHQPYRLRKYSIYDIGKKTDYFEAEEGSGQNNEEIFRKVAKKSYLPTNKTLLKMLKRHPEFKISFSLSGVVLEQAEEYMPEVIDSFADLVKTGRVEILGETYYHSLAFLYDRDEFKHQVNKHAAKVKDLFGVVPEVFRNTELIYSDEVGQAAYEMGYKGVIAEGADHILGWKNSNFLYHPPKTPGIKLLLKNYKLSDDIAFRFSNQGWEEYPLTAEKFSHWVSNTNGNGHLINLFMDYETFGEHQWEDTGIFRFLERLPREIYKHPHNDFVTPSEAVERYDTHDEISYPHYVSWADIERDLSAWRSNAMQYDALHKIYELGEEIQNIDDADLTEDWRRLQTSDHFYYMCTKWFNDGDVHKYFSPYESPYTAFISYMNVLQDMQLRVEKASSKLPVKKKQPVLQDVA